jgi:hypothetical protein
MARDKRTDTSAGEERSMWSRPGTIGALALVVFALAGAIALAFRPDPGPAPADEDTTSAEPEVEPSALPLPEAGPADTRWEVISGGAIVPVSAEHGPGSGDGTLAAGFAPTPEGALIAAVHILARSGSDQPDATWQAAIAEQMVAGADADSLAAANAVAPAGDPGAERAHLSGFTYASFTGDQAVFTLYLTQADSIFAVEVTMVWDGADWDLTPPRNGDWANELTMVFSLEGVILWGPDV